MGAEPPLVRKNLTPPPIGQIPDYAPVGYCCKQDIVIFARGGSLVITLQSLQFHTQVLTSDLIKEIDTNDDENKENKSRDNTPNMKTNHHKQM